MIIQRLFFCGRGFGKAGKKPEKKVLKELAGSFSDDTSNTITKFLKIGNAESVMVELYDEEENQMLWHLYLVHHGRSYYMGVALPPGTGKSPFPKKVMGIINQIEFLR